MRNLQCTITDMRKKVFAEVAKLAYEGGDYYTRMEKLPYELDARRGGHRPGVYFPGAGHCGRADPPGHGPSPASMCPSIRLLSDGVEESAIAEKYYDPPLINIIKYACHACPDTHYRGHQRLPGVPGPALLTTPVPRGPSTLSTARPRSTRPSASSAASARPPAPIRPSSSSCAPLPGGLRHGRHRQGRPRPGPDQL